MKSTINIIALTLFFFTSLSAEIAILSIEGVTSPEACKGEITLLATGNAGPFHVEIMETGLVMSPVSGEILISNLCEGLFTINIHPIDFPHCITQLSAFIPINPALVAENNPPSFSSTQNKVEDLFGHQNSEKGIINISPNPSRGRIIVNFSWELTPSTKIEVFNTNGQSVYADEIKTSFKQASYDFSHLPAGQYFFSVSPPDKIPVRENFIIN